MSAFAPPFRSAARFRRGAIAWLFLLAALSAWAAPAAQPVWRTGWYAQPPLQFSSQHGEFETVTGLDVQLIRAIAREAGRQVRFEQVPWDKQQEQLRTGERELAFGATWTAEREKYVRFSEPYRFEENALYVRTDELPRFAFKDAPGFLAQVRSARLRVGVVRATAYLLPEVDAFVRDPANASHLVISDTDAENLETLVAGGVDAAITERLAAATITTQLGFDTFLTEHPVPFGRDAVRAMFSRAATTEADVADFNRALRAVQASGAFDKILRGYLLAPLLEITIGGRWFFWLDILGTVAFALSGVILAHRGRYNLIGAFVLSALPAVGGGILRDLVTGRKPVGVLRSPIYLLIVVGVVLGGYLFFKLVERAPALQGPRVQKFASAFDALWAFFDTIGLAAFIVIGVRIAVDMHCDPLWLWGPLLAVLTGAGGGILRDIVRADFHNPTLKRGFYAEVALVWGLAFSLFLEWEVRRMGLAQIQWGTYAVLLGAFASRMVILRRGWENPFQLGNRHTRPERRLAALGDELRSLGRALPAWFEERAGIVQPRSLVEIEKLHSAALHRIAALHAAAHDLEREPLTPELAARAAAFRRQVGALALAEDSLYELVREPAFAGGTARSLQETIFASVAPRGDPVTGETRAEDPATERDPAAAIAAVRAQLAAVENAIAADERARMLQFAERFERLMKFLHDARPTGAAASTP